MIKIIFKQGHTIEYPDVQCTIQNAEGLISLLDGNQVIIAEVQQVDIESMNLVPA